MLALAASLLATVAPAGCLARTPVEPAPNSWPPARSELAPPGASAIRLCRYSPLDNHSAPNLVASALVTRPATIRALASDLDELKRFSGAVFCPNDNGSAITLTLGYPSGHSVFIRVGLTGCQAVSNGSVTRTAATSAAGRSLLATIEALTRTS